ncbi:hypothetical protein GCM10010245_89730 [Streptomyces spectabilis]|uniref:Uncharacterized protein n=1 Tax=Streptomyces spectabilis TaxID=68270 RepID=A0A7W8B417_STRST|nr:hypothetical protein [Streptomyces spectabilis]GGV56719.1 hypothetical protein GCM10010245_89730 [Streptomyces spectabilis]
MTAPLPPMPWRMRGAMRLGVLPLARPLFPPPPLTPVLAYRLVITAVRYFEGDVRYDVLFLATLVRHRCRVGMYLHHVWSDNPQIRAAGPDLWGLNPEPAQFAWSDTQVQLIMDHGDSAVLTTSSRRAPSLTAVGAMPCFTLTDKGPAYGFIPILGRATPRNLTVTAWPAHFPELAHTHTSCALDLSRFRITIPRPHSIAW